MDVHRLDRAQARRIAIRAQLLAAPRPTDLLDRRRRLTFLQIDPTAAVAPSADLVAWSRLGRRTSPADLRDGHRAGPDARSRPTARSRPMARPARLCPRRDGGVAEPERSRRVARANDSFRRDILDRLEAAGPLLSREHPRHERRAVAVVRLDQQPQRHPDARVPGAARRGRDRRRRGPTALLGPGRAGLSGRRAGRRARARPRRIRNERRLRALGIARADGDRRARRAGRRRRRRRAGRGRGGRRASGGSTRRTLDGGRSRGARRCCRPSTGSIHDRVARRRALRFRVHPGDVQAQGERRWGYFALPILHGDRLVGKVDATADRKARRARVNAIHEDVPFTPDVTRAVHEELHDLASWLSLTVEGLR